MRRRWIAAGLGLLLSFLIVWQLWPQSSTEKRLRMLAGLPTSERVTPSTARQALLQHLPPGTQSADVHMYLDQHSMGTDGQSSCTPVNAPGNIQCRIDLDPTALNVVKESFGIVFVLDTQRRVKDITVERWLTGP